MAERHSQSPELGDAVQLNPGETLDSDRMLDEPLDSGYIPPDRPSPASTRGTTADEQVEGESLDERLHEEEPESRRAENAGRAGRLVTDDEGVRESESKQSIAHDAGVDGGAASAEEAAVHTEEPPD